MTAGEFETKHSARWLEFERMLAALEKGAEFENAGAMPKRFREVCADLSLARARMYGGEITERLNGLVIRSYELLYRQRRTGWMGVAEFFAGGFPRAMRREWRLFFVCTAVFVIPFLAALLSSRHDIQWIQSILGVDGMRMMEGMYGHRSAPMDHLRAEHGSNFMMFCYYIKHNIGIDFQIFAGGMLAGIGTLYFLLYNGVFLGAAAGYVNHAGDPETFWSFVSGHAPYELTGMIVAGMAGMRLGLAILRPGRMPRGKALVEAGKLALPLISGAGALTFVAAVFEGFWSAGLASSEIKYAVGFIGWILLAGYFLFVGRKEADEA